MSFYIIRTVACWLVWFIFADKKRWREILPVCIFALLLGQTTDSIMHHYKLWEFHPHSMFIDLLDDFSIYFVATYLFIQWLPQQKNVKKMLIYFVIWTSAAFAIEWYHIAVHYMEYFKWWNLGLSYVADWVLFYIFYRFYHGFNLKRLSGVEPSLEESLENIDDVFFIVDREGKLIRSHGKWLRNHQVELGMNYGKTIEEYVGSGNDMTIHYDALKNALKGERTLYETEWYLSRTGTYHHFQTSVSPLIDEKGNIVGAIGIGRDLGNQHPTEPMHNTRYENSFNQ